MINAIYRYISSIINYSVIFDIEGKGEGRKIGRIFLFAFFFSPPKLIFHIDKFANKRIIFAVTREVCKLARYVFILFFKNKEIRLH